MQISLSDVTATESGWLEDALHQTFGEFDHSFLDAMKPQLDWVRVPAGNALFHQHEQESALYFVVAGRLRAIVRDESGAERAVGDIRRGETLGEMALFTGQPRSATVVAIRDSLLVRLSRESYEKVIRAYPLVSLHVSRFVVERIQRAGDPRLSWAKPTMIAVLPATRGGRAGALARDLQSTMARYGTVDCLDAKRLAGELGEAALGDGNHGDDGRWERVSRWIDEKEAASDLVLLLGDEPDSKWSRHCIRHADEILWVADAADADIDGAFSTVRNWPGLDRTLARQTLLLCHPADTKSPRTTRLWLDRFEGNAHLHLRQGHAGDLGRVGRILMGKAVGLVFSGGGARGFAHLGVLKAIEEAGIPVDYLGGCSIGSVIAGYAASDRPAEELIGLARKAFSKNPTRDINPLPLISLIRGKQLRLTIDSAVRELTGFDADIEDSWKPLYCIASNLSRSVEAILERGELARAIRASVSIPAALPPVIIDGELMIDGGTFNNFPTDVMARRGAGLILGCDLMRDGVRKLDLDETPSSGALAFDRLRPRSRRRYRLPGLASIMLNVSILNSQSRLAESRAHTDVCFTPDLGRIGMLDWSAFDKVVDAGYRHAQSVLADLPESLKKRLADVSRV
ncbi:MAG: patatin-like phospholipase family protein [Sulfuritalea sp.]|nr:patatin-like phospholipase family protein [Sulfuritalea sp.]